MPTYDCIIKALEKLKLQLAEADAAVVEARKRAPEDAGPKILGEGLVIDEWVSKFTYFFYWKSSLVICHFFYKCFTRLHLHL